MFSINRNCWHFLESATTRESSIAFPLFKLTPSSTETLKEDQISTQEGVSLNGAYSTAIPLVTPSNVSAFVEHYPRLITAVNSQVPAKPSSSSPCDGMECEHNGTCLVNVDGEVNLLLSFFLNEHRNFWFLVGMHMFFRLFAWMLVQLCFVWTTRNAKLLTIKVYADVKLVLLVNCAKK